MKPVSPYLNLTTQERISRAMNDKSFADFCKRERKQKYFDEMLPLVEKIATIDISGVNYNAGLISQVHFLHKKKSSGML